jgi:hypothetical protein
MDDQRTELTIELGVEGADETELDSLTTRLRQELLQLDVDEVERPSAGPAPEGSRAIELAAAGALVVGLIRDNAVIESLIGTLQGWLARDQSRTIKVTLDGDTIELSGASDEDRRRLIRHWVAAHGRD